MPHRPDGETELWHAGNLGSDDLMIWVELGAPDPR